MNSQNNSRPNSGGSSQGNKNFKGGGHYRGNRRRYRGGKAPNKPSQPQNQATNPQHSLVDKLVEKYINLLDQHLIARRKYHDLFYRAEGAQKAKLEKNFFQTMNEVREFENRMSPDVREKFDKRINGLKNDQTYSTNHQINPDEIKIEVADHEIADPHLLNSQKMTDYANDQEESAGTIEDYNKYKMYS